MNSSEEEKQLQLISSLKEQGRRARSCQVLAVAARGRGWLWGAGCGAGGSWAEVAATATVTVTPSRLRHPGERRPPRPPRLSPGAEG